MEVQTQWGTVLVVVSVEVVVEEVVKLVSRENIRAGVHHGTARDILVIGRVLPTVQLVHHHLPDGVRAGGAALQVAVATVWHAEVHGVGPQRRVREGRSDGAVVEEGLFLHHSELVVTTDAQVRRAHAHHAVVRDISELLDDDPHASHLLAPVVYRGVAPEALVIVMPVKDVGH